MLTRSVTTRTILTDPLPPEGQRGNDRWSPGKKIGRQAALEQCSASHGTIFDRSCVKLSSGAFSRNQYATECEHRCGHRMSVRDEPRRRPMMSTRPLMRDIQTAKTK